ncbi:F-actin-capping protein subunit alpha [Entophlyctis luteolus]|nr:F-actin-capping protein subunit alpha [Entophlyctis luteolus]
MSNLLCNAAHNALAADYINTIGRCPPPNFDAWTEFAVENRCPTDFASDYGRLYRDIAPWLEAGTINPDTVTFPREQNEWNIQYINIGVFENSSFSFDPFSFLAPIAHILPSKRFVYMLSSIDYPVVLPSDPLGLESRYENPQDMLKRSSCLNREYPAEVRDAHGFFSHPWRFLVQNARMPVFSRAKLECFEDLLIPGDYHMQQARMLQDFADSVAWTQKRPVLFWRGSTTGGLLAEHTAWKTFHRTRLLDWHAEHATEGTESTVEFDIGIHAVTNAPELEFIERFVKIYPYKPFVPFGQIVKFKYLLVVDGNTWPGRLQWFLATNSVVLLAGIFKDYFMWRLEPWVHYIPVKLDFSDLEERLVWLKQNDEAAKQIAQNAQRLVKPINRLSAMQCYTALAFLEYSNLYNNTRQG